MSEVSLAETFFVCLFFKPLFINKHETLVTLPQSKKQWLNQLSLLVSGRLVCPVLRSLGWLTCLPLAEAVVSLTSLSSGNSGAGPCWCDFMARDSSSRSHWWPHVSVFWRIMFSDLQAGVGYMKYVWNYICLWMPRITLQGSRFPTAAMTYNYT